MTEVPEGARGERLYGPDDLSPTRCAYCGGPLLAELVESEPWFDTHPACPDPPPPMPRGRRPR